MSANVRNAHRKMARRACFQRGSKTSMALARDSWWAQAGPLSTISPELEPALRGLPHDPVELCRVAQGLVMLPNLAAGFGIADHRQEERSIRSANNMLRQLLELDGAPVVQDRSPDQRVMGTCRHFALLSCAFLRYRGIPARARCGFATYFMADKYLDHWVTEYLDDRGRWVRIDSEILGFSFVEHPEDLAVGEFLTGGEAWQFLAESGVNPADFGVDGAPHAWDLIGKVAEACATGDQSVIEQMYQTEDLTVPAHLIN